MQRASRKSLEDSLAFLNLNSLFFPMFFAPLGRREQQQWAEELFQQVGGWFSLLGWDVVGRRGSARMGLSVSEMGDEG